MAKGAGGVVNHTSKLKSYRGAGKRRSKERLQPEKEWWKFKSLVKLTGNGTGLRQETMAAHHESRSGVVPPHQTMGNHAAAQKRQCNACSQKLKSIPEAAIYECRKKTGCRPTRFQEPSCKVSVSDLTMFQDLMQARDSNTPQRLS